MFEKLRNLDIDPVVGRALHAVMFTVGHPHPRKPHGKHPHHRHESRNDTEPHAYQGLVGLADVLEHTENGENIAQFGKSKEDDSDSN
ncbi:hypothetical protein OESDEN_19216 [Oesophagostomum dentatum]|uniref:Uncharacterized protein n=1 Tax=Oesophagostomum dentatum TaxID=61180 RepID=A0A0B1S6Y9_OESDE|nr:hypothetical protein OESDEN_19216 [Oesophagostomum dentatum]